MKTNQNDAATEELSSLRLPPAEPARAVAPASYFRVPRCVDCGPDAPLPVEVRMVLEALADNAVGTGLTEPEDGELCRLVNNYGSRAIDHLSVCLSAADAGRVREAVVNRRREACGRRPWDLPHRLILIWTDVRVACMARAMMASAVAAQHSAP